MSSVETINAILNERKRLIEEIEKELPNLSEPEYDNIPWPRLRFWQGYRKGLYKAIDIINKPL